MKIKYLILFLNFNILYNYLVMESQKPYKTDF